MEQNMANDVETGIVQWFIRYDRGLVQSLINF